LTSCDNDFPVQGWLKQKGKETRDVVAHGPVRGDVVVVEPRVESEVRADLPLVADKQVPGLPSQVGAVRPRSPRSRIRNTEKKVGKRIAAVVAVECESPLAQAVRTVVVGLMRRETSA